jgi:uncharacterized protein YkwD
MNIGVRGASAPVLIAVLALSACALPMPANALGYSAKRKPPSFCAHASLRPTPTNTAAIDRAALCLVNQVRATYQLRPLRANHELQAVATTLVRGMVNRNYYSDNSPSGQSPGALIAAIPYGARAASLSTAQDLGWGTLTDATPAGIVTAWMHSPPHREIILTAAFRDAGAGVVPAVPSVIAPGAPGATYAIEFGARS